MPEITQEDFDLFEAYKQLGTVDEINSTKDVVALDLAVSHTGFKRTVLAKLIKGLPEGYSVVSSSDKTIVHTPDGEKDLAEFAEEEWADFLPSLKNVEKKEGGSQVPYIAQTSVERDAGTKNVGKKVANNYILQRYGAALKAESVN